jgi:hypothetical protein
MFKKFLLISSVFSFAFAILFISILQASKVPHVFTVSPLNLSTLNFDILGTDSTEIDYILPFAGAVLPDSPLWGLKAIRDRIWYLMTDSPIKKAELALLFADKRLVSGKILLENKKPDIAVSTITKGEKYLEVAMDQEEIARKEGLDTSEFLTKIAIASLKHREVLEKILPYVPEEGRPFVIKSEDYSRESFKSAKDLLNSKGLTIPNSPFDGD